MTIPELPSTQKVAWIQSPGPNGHLVIRDNIEVQQPANNEILVKMECSGICHSDCHNVLGLGIFTDIPGHEGVGTVVKLGPGSPASLLGKRVGIKWLWSACGKCIACASGRVNNCGNQLNTGRSVRGTLQQYVLAHSQFVTLIPEGVKSEVAAPLLCAGLSLAGAVSKCEPELKKGDWVVIVGAGGGLGHVGVQIAAKTKGYKVIAIDTGAEKEKLCKEMGATAFVDYAKEDVIESIRALTEGEGAHAVICVAGSERAYEQAPSLIRNNGVFVIVGLPPRSFMFPMSPIDIANRGLIIKGSSTGTSEQMDELLQHALEGKITPKIEVYDFEESPKIIQELMRYEVSGRKVVRAPA
ncbi:alcohol dehydrogenase [Sporormia fimetaria CBS 119925]|uniref:Alcohol dehydrogenase n=1 Tax=Sporormia fimetaria CBS 119925 TaxID=1340428 RepID=A0A6A6V996_9PLEO|nr:alcohol dehydrogenase [Sporormia fimetaria CBS 119925]